MPKHIFIVDQRKILSVEKDKRKMRKLNKKRKE